VFYGPLEARHHLSVQQWRILLALAQHPGATAVDIIARWRFNPRASAAPVVNSNNGP
jgi:DNA-binding MarR family transcriptional regulator